MAEKKIYEEPKFEVVEPDEGNGANTRLPYGIAKGMGLNTDGMTPRQVWEMLKRRGINPENEYDKLKEKATEEIKEDKPKEVDASSFNIDFESSYFKKAFSQIEIPYKNVGRLQTILSEKQIISKISGGDKTKGSCSSLALAYVGNKAGLDVLDFRGGASLSFFSTNKTMQEIAKLKGVKSFMVKNNNDYKAVSDLIVNVRESKDYILATGKHTAIIRKENGKFLYCELQSPNSEENSFKPLNNSVLKNRFKCVKSNTFYRQKIDPINILIDCDTLSKNRDFKNLLGFINTSKEKQQKGKDGNVK